MTPTIHQLMRGNVLEVFNERDPEADVLQRNLGPVQFVADGPFYALDGFHPR